VWQVPTTTVMTTPRPDGPPRSDSPALITRVEWPGLDTEFAVPGTGVVLRVANRANGNAGISALPGWAEREVDRFMAQYLQVVFPVDADGKPLPDPTGELHRLGKVCEGGAELLVTDQRLVVVVVKGSGGLGVADDERGAVVVVDLPHRALGAVSRTRRKGFLGKVKDSGVRLDVVRPVGAIRVEPLARVDQDLRNPERVDDQAFADSLVHAAAELALTAHLMESSERQRLRRVLDGERTGDGLDVVAEIVQ
jgi:hypothetical protein